MKALILALLLVSTFCGVSYATSIPGGASTTPSRIAQGGATTGEAMLWDNGTGWTPDTVSGSGDMLRTVYDVAQDGSADTANALLGTPALCPGGQAPLGIDANGDANGCFAVADGEFITRNATTGVLTGGEITINADTTKFDLAAGTGIVVDWTTPSAPVYNDVSWSQQLAITVTGIATNTFTTLGINSSGTLVQFPGARMTPQERRSYITLQAIVHINSTVIDTVTANNNPAYEVSRSILDYIEVLGAINNGNGYTSNGVNLNVDKVAGVTTLPFVNRGIDPQDPTNHTDAAQTAISTLIFNYQDGAGDVTVVPSQSALDPEFYDDGSGTLAAVGSNDWQIQRFYFFSSSGSTIVAYGQATYNSLSEARAAVFTEDFVPNPRAAAGKFTTVVLLRDGATDLSNPAQAEFIAITEGSGNSGTFSPNANAATDHSSFNADVDARIAIINETFDLAGAAPTLWFEETDAASDNRDWGIKVDNTQLDIFLCDDARSICSTIFRAGRTGGVMDSLVIGPPLHLQVGTVSLPGLIFGSDEPSAALRDWCPTSARAARMNVKRVTSMILF